MKKSILLYSVLLVNIGFVNSQTELKLERNNSLKKIRKGKECSFYLTPILFDSIVEKKQIYFGKVANYNDSILIIKSKECNTKNTYPDGRYILNYDVYGYNIDTTINLRLNDIEKIEYFKDWFLFPAFLGFTSIGSAVIAAPLIAANFRENTFNTNLYKKLVGYSLATGAVSLTFAHTFGQKNYYLNCPNNKSKCKNWKLKIL